MHAWLDFVTKLQKYTSFEYSWSTSEEFKNVYAVLPNQLLAANDDAVTYRMEEYANSSLIVILHCLNSFRHHYVIFSLLYLLLRKNYKINDVCFPSFHNDGQSHM